ncbi:transcriptional regulator [Chryseobacterium lactis]|uniref:Transcriptional regulator n=1 Tax=Chryseobacterium lactis TaxID=1241981 RepID=A0A3G6RIU4_CHRLC|nr:BlaI/MecI/CopY family transcriptional regulator [Chryseobacterium lactis]AZA83409.1 transcriptional regulator [Chryseobacterium lactis]AZB03793.1 transcriptional regulator [Chryseobacterium lactis]PNW11630.1 transcriptional regulator [Chryseobacterium lactis]
MKINHLTAAEENFMKLFWKMESFYLKDIMEQHPEPKPHQNTVSTYLKILVEKGYLSTVKEGRIFKYTVIVPFEDYKKFLLKELSHHFFNDSGKEILEFLFSEKLLSQDDLKGYFDLKIEIKPAKPAKSEEPKFEYAEEILNPKKEKEKKGKTKEKEKEKEKDKKKKKKKE